ncbi:MAG: hypothetical protein K1X79_05500 [Oligoflexia bacterium]|nr:hypothetical protein [Oligoflexia bacterium]
MSMFAKAGQAIAAAAALSGAGSAETSVQQDVLAALNSTAGVTASAADMLAELRANGEHLQFSPQEAGSRPSSSPAGQDPVKQQEKPAEKKAEGSTPQDAKAEGKGQEAKPHSSSAAELLRSAGGKKAAPATQPAEPAGVETGKGQGAPAGAAPTTKPAVDPASQNQEPGKKQEPAQQGAAGQVGKPAEQAGSQATQAQGGPETKPASQPVALQPKADPAVKFLNMTPEEIQKLSPQDLQKAIVEVETATAEARKQIEAANASIEIKQRIIEKLDAGRVDLGEGKYSYDPKVQNEALRELSAELESKRQELAQRAKELDERKQAQSQAPSTGVPTQISEMAQSINNDREGFKREVGETAAELGRRREEIQQGFANGVRDFNRESGIIDVRKLWANVPDPNDPNNPVRQILDKVVVDPSKNPAHAAAIQAAMRPVTVAEIDQMVRGDKPLPSVGPTGSPEELASRLINSLGDNMNAKADKAAAEEATKAQVAVIESTVPKDARGAMVRTLADKIGRDAASLVREAERLEKVERGLGSGDPNQLTPWQEGALNNVRTMLEMQTEAGRAARDAARREAELGLERGQQKGEALLNEARRKRDEGPLGGIIKIGG